MKKYEELIEQKLNILEDMIDYIEDFNDDPDYDVGYNKKDVTDCDDILSKFLKEISKSSNANKDKVILEIVKDTVLSLNSLNERCSGALIETEQREQICDLIIHGAKIAGYEHPNYDITEEWREW